MNRRSLMCPLLLMAWGQQALAQPCGVSYGYPVSYPTYTPYREVVKIVEKLVPVEVFTPVFVPTFTVSYTPPAAAPLAAAAPAPAPAPAVAAAMPSPECALLLAEIRKIGARQDALEARLSGQTPVRQGAPQPGPADEGSQGPAAPIAAADRLTVLRNKCAACHTAGRLDPETSLALLDQAGNALPLPDAMELRLLRRCYVDEMPPKGNKKGIAPLTNREYSALFAGQGAKK